MPPWSADKLRLKIALYGRVLIFHQCVQELSAYTVLTGASPTQSVVLFRLRADRSRSAVLERTVRDRHHQQTPSR